MVGLQVGGYFFCCAGVFNVFKVNCEWGGFCLVVGKERREESFCVLCGVGVVLWPANVVSGDCCCFIYAWSCFEFAGSYVYAAPWGQGRAFWEFRPGAAWGCLKGGEALLVADFGFFCGFVQYGDCVVYSVG